LGAWADVGVTEPDLDADYQVGVGARHLDRAVDLRHADVLELADRPIGDAVVVRHAVGGDVEQGQDPRGRDLDNVAAEAGERRRAGRAGVDRGRDPARQAVRV